MLRNILVTIISVLLVVALGLIGYLFYVYAKGAYVARNQNQNNKPTNTQEGDLSVPAGAPIPLNSPQQTPLPVVDSPQGSGQIPLGAVDSAGNPGNSDNPNNNQKNQPVSISMDTANWKTYTNKKYNYSFKYPQEYDYSSCDKNTPCRFGQIFEKDGGDSAWLNGAVNNQGWPFIAINHYDNESYTLPKNVKFMDWLTQKMGWTKDKAPKDFNFSIATTKGDTKKAMKVEVPATPQAYAREEIYFEKDNKIFEIQLMSSDKEPAQQFYSTWLKTFVLE